MKKVRRKNSRRRKRHHSAEPFFQMETSGAEMQHDFNTEPRFVPTTLPIQAKLNFGQPNDKYEKEADAMADKVVHGESAHHHSGNTAPAVQSKCEECEAEGAVQMQTEEEEAVQMQTEEEEEAVQTKMNPTTPHTHHVHQGFESKLKSATGRGKALKTNTKREMNAEFGADFGGVRVHTDDDAVQMNQSLGAQAFTHGKDIYFNKGKYNPDSKKGKHLLAHELTHVVQQKQAPVNSNQVQKKGLNRPHGSAPNIQLANTPDGVFLGPTDRSKAFCTKQTLWATTATQNTATRANGIQRIWFKGKNSGTNDDGKNCSCDCGEYRHWIRGYWRSAAGGAKRFNVSSCGNALNINEGSWTEEFTSCIGDNDADACIWRYGDSPGWNNGLSNGTYVELHYEFKFQIWDKCQNRSVAQARRTLDISGNTHPRTITWTR